MTSHNEDINLFFSKHTPENSVLILDGTGPGVTMQLPVLASIGLDRLLSFDEVHGFSGGALAYLVYWAFENKLLRHDGAHLVAKFDSQFRRNHHSNFFGAIHAIYQLLRKRPAFGEERIRTHIRYIFSDGFLSMKPHELPANLIFYVGMSGSPDPIAFDHNERLSCDLDLETLLCSIVSIPFAYGRISGRYYDAVFSKNFRSLYRDLISRENRKTLVSSMWRPRLIDGTTFVNPIGKNNPHRRLRSDSMRLLLNFPNARYGAEIAKSFRKD